MIIPIRTIEAGENLGALSFFETGQDIDFEIKRIYYITQVSKGIERGFHAHKNLKQVLFCPHGKIEILLDDGEKVERVLLDDPSKALVIYPTIWRTMTWKTDDAVLCVCASEIYDECDYIRDYNEFKKYINIKEKR